MTGQQLVNVVEVIEALAAGECVKGAGGWVRKLCDGLLRVWRASRGWQPSCALPSVMATGTIVPDPSVPPQDLELPECEGYEAYRVLAKDGSYFVKHRLMGGWVVLMQNEGRLPSEWAGHVGADGRLYWGVNAITSPLHSHCAFVRCLAEPAPIGGREG